MDIKFYCGVNETKWNHHPVSPGDYVCVSPVMGSSTKNIKENRVFIPTNVKEVIVDSGAFCDGVANRVSYKSALDRQLRHMEKYKYFDRVTHIASYDLLIDEKWDTFGNRHKTRWNKEESESAVETTIKAAEFSALHKDGFNVILSAQGVTLDQYMRCAVEIVPLMSESDIFGFGGWCILGIKRNSLRNEFRSIITNVIPFLAEKKVSLIHIWGMMYAPALGELLWMCDKYKIQLSLDSSGPQKRPVFGSWGYADWKDKNYVVPNTLIRGQERSRHVQVVTSWLSNFRLTKWYKSPFDSGRWSVSDD